MSKGENVIDESSENNLEICLKDALSDFQEFCVSFVGKSFVPIEISQESNILKVKTPIIKGDDKKSIEYTSLSKIKEPSIKKIGTIDLHPGDCISIKDFIYSDKATSNSYFQISINENKSHDVNMKLLLDLFDKSAVQTLGEKKALINNVREKIIEAKKKSEEESASVPIITTEENTKNIFGRVMSKILG